MASRLKVCFGISLSGACPLAAKSFEPWTAKRRNAKKEFLEAHYIAFIAIVIV